MQSIQTSKIITINKDQDIIIRQLLDYLRTIHYQSPNDYSSIDPVNGNNEMIQLKKSQIYAIRRLVYNLDYFIGLYLNNEMGFVAYVNSLV